MVELFNVGFILLDESGVLAMITTMDANKELSYEEIDQALDRLDDASVMLTHQVEMPGSEELTFLE